MGLFSSMNIGTRGLQASQMGMDITSQNISNADVDGYSRKVLNLTTDYRYDPSYGQIGMGVDVVNIERMRNSYIDQQIQQQTQEQGMYQKMDDKLQSIESILNEPTDNSIMTSVDSFFSSWGNLANNPADLSARTAVRTTAETMVNGFHNAADEMMKLQSSCNDEITDTVGKINDDVKQLSDLNREIGQVAISGQNANDSLDKRDQLLKDLSQYTDVSTIVNSLGQVTVTTGGNILVSPVDYQLLETSSTTYKNTDGTSSTNVGVRFATSKRDFTPSSGQLAGLVNSRDVLIPQYLNNLNELAAGLTAKVNAQHEQGYTLNGYSGVDFFSPGALDNVTGKVDPVTAYNMSLSPSITSDLNNLAAAGGGVLVNTSEIISTTFGAAVDAKLTQSDIALSSVVVKDTVTGNVLVQGTDYIINPVTRSFKLMNNIYNAVPLSVTYSYNSNGSKGSGDNSNATAIAALSTSLTMSPDALGNESSTYDQYYSGFVGQLGLARQEADSNVTTRQNLVSQYQTQQDSVAGVSSDEELTNLVKYQHAYQAAARIITTADSMLDTLIKM